MKLMPEQEALSAGGSWNIGYGARRNPALQVKGSLELVLAKQDGSTSSVRPMRLYSPGQAPQPCQSPE